MKRSKHTWSLFPGWKKKRPVFGHVTIILVYAPGFKWFLLLTFLKVIISWFNL